MTQYHLVCHVYRTSELEERLDDLFKYLNKEPRIKREVKIRPLGLLGYRTRVIIRSSEEVKNG